MADISTELTALMNAVYGEEVRSAFRDALLKMNNDVIGLIQRENLYQMTQEEFTALKTSLINQINAAAAAAKGTIPEDYSALSDTVAKLLDASYPNIMWQAGSLSDTGSDQSSDYVCRSNFIPVTNILGDDIKSKLNVSVTGNYKVEVYKYLIYDRDKNFNRTVTRNHIYPIGYSTTENMPLDLSPADGYVRLVAGCVDSDNQPVSHVTYQGSVFTELKASLKVYTTLSWLWEGIEELETDLDEKITDLKADLNDITDDIISANVTDNLNVTNNGVTFVKDSDSILKVYGTALGNRRQLFLNGQNSGMISSSPFQKTLDAGTYLVEASVSGYLTTDWYIDYTYSTFANSSRLVNYLTPTKKITFTSPVMIGVVFSTDQNYGTENNATYITLNITKLSAKDIKARDMAEQAETATSLAERTFGIANYDQYFNRDTITNTGVTFAYDNSTGRYTFSGTLPSNDYAVYHLINEPTFAKFKANTPVYVDYNTTDVNVYPQIYYYKNGTTTYLEQLSANTQKWVVLPSDAEGIFIRVRTSKGVSLNGSFTISVTGTILPKGLAEESETIKSLAAEMPKKLGYDKVLTSTDDLNDYKETGAYLWLSSNHPSNVPDTDSNSIMIVLHAYNNSGFVLQTVHTNFGKMYQRLMGSSAWFDWSEISAGSSGGTSIENTYNITTSPTITTDANGWLQAVDTDTSDETGKTDMTGAIMSMLTDTGYCHLGEGIFYVSGNIDMPEGSTLCGCGRKTIVRLLQTTTTGYCVKIGVYCTIKDISFEGARSFTVPSSKGTRNGIAFMANYDADPSVQTKHCMISNIWVKNFSGAGLYCHNTSIRYDRGLYALNVFIDDCYVGIDIDYYSEFNKFVNVCTAWCKYGCINNGGNNVFSSCTFHATDTGFYIDGTQPNSAHGTITGCTFCHIGSNAGKAISINSSTNGFVIDSCQIWYNSIEFINSSGIVVSNCELGRGTTGAGATINVNGGDTVIFDGCMFMNDVNYAPDITITNNTKVKFNNCYGSISGNAITA